ncbi:MAG: hydroxyacid dehydrogenase [Planctomycetota bacterium]
MLRAGQPIPTAFLLDPDTLGAVYGAAGRDRAELLSGRAPGRFDPAEFMGSDACVDGLTDVRVVLSGWGMPRLEPSVLAALPNLELVLYAAGSVAGFMTDAAWERGVRVCSASAINAGPTAEFAAAQVVLGLKGFWGHASALRGRPSSPAALAPDVGVGMHGARVGLVSLGLIGQAVAERLARTQAEVVAYDPYIDKAKAAQIGAALVQLPELFETSRVVSLHTPWLPETEGIVGGALLRSMPQGACLINTSRGAVVNEPELIEVARERPDLDFLLDVTHPHEPPLPDSPLYTLPNVWLSPHIAGSTGSECQAMGAAMLDELERWCAGKPLLHELSRGVTQASAHASPRSG